MFELNIGNAFEVQNALQLCFQLAFIEVPQTVRDAADVTLTDLLNGVVILAYAGAVIGKQDHGRSNHGDQRANHDDGCKQTPYEGR